MFNQTTTAKVNSNPTESELYQYPPCWQDDARVQVLLAPFRNRNVNIENYDSKMQFWQDTIKEYCIFKGKAHFSKQELMKTFTKGQRVPRCFDLVIEEMLKAKRIRLRTEYEYDPDNTWSGWAINIVFKPVYWGFDKVKGKFGVSDASNLGLVEFIHLDVMKKYCSKLQEVLFQAPYLGTLHHYDKLHNELCPALNICEECLCLCLRTLSIQRKIGLEYKPNINGQQIHLVKIPSNEDSNINITDADHAIHNLEVTKRDLEKKLEEIDAEIKDNESKTLQYIKENKRTLAKTFLRKKRLLEKNQERRILALNNIETLLFNVHEAKLNGVILDTYKFGSKALQNVLEQSNLKYDDVDEIVSDVKETMDSFREVQDTLANVNLNESLDTLGNEDELERELRDIMGESHKSTPTETHADKNKNISDAKSLKVEITNAELLDMLNGLEIKENSSVDAAEKVLYT